MLSLKQSAALFLFCLAAFSPYFFTPTVAGLDSYHYLFALKVPESAFIGIKAALFLCLFASTYSVALLGKAIEPKLWTAGFFCFGSIVWLMDSWKFETEQFAYPLLFLSLYLFFSNHKWLALIPIAAAAILWQGSALYLIALGLSWRWLLLSIIPIAYFGWNKLGGLLPNFSVQENMPVFGQLYHAALIFGYSFVPKKLLLTLSFFFLLGLANSKYAIHSVPFLAVGMAKLFWETKNLWVKSFAMAVPILGVLIASMMLVSYPLTGEQASAARLAVQEANGETIYNDWGYGHAIAYFGGVPKARAGGAWDVNCSDCIRLTELELQPPCRCLNCPSRLAVYKC